MLWLMFSILIALGIVMFTYLIIRTRKGPRHHRSKAKEPASVLIVVGSGGHTSEILQLVKVLGSHYSPRYYVMADTDTMSEHKVKQCEKERSANGGTKDSEYQLFYIPRSREVKQSYITSVLTTLRALIFSMPLVFRLRPEVILCNGPGTCIPICVAGCLLKWLGLQRTTIVYVESFCRVTSLSLSGKLLYPVADIFCVHWPELAEKYPRTLYMGRLV